MRRLGKATAIGIATAFIDATLALTPPGTALEERFGLSWLFWARGPLPPPQDVAVISLDWESSERFGLPAKVREWLRTIYARAIDRLAEAGAPGRAAGVPRPREPPDAAPMRSVLPTGPRRGACRSTGSMSRPIGRRYATAWLRPGSGSGAY